MVQRGYHCAYDIHYHIVFPVKYRKALLSTHIEEKIKEISIAIEERYEIRMESIGLDEDHIHILCSAHPKYSIGMIVQRYKSITTKELFKTFPELKRELWGGELWSDGYYAATIGERGNRETVERYICYKVRYPASSAAGLFKSTAGSWNKYAFFVICMDIGAFIDDLGGVGAFRCCLFTNIWANERGDLEACWDRNNVFVTVCEAHIGACNFSTRFHPITATAIFLPCKHSQSSTKGDQQ